MTHLDTPTRARIIEGTVESERAREDLVPRERRLHPNLRGGAAYASSATFIELGREQRVETFEPAETDTRPEAVTRGPCPWCETRGEFGCKHQKPYLERTFDA